MFATLNVRVTLISGFFFASRKFHVIRYTEVSLHLIVPKLATPDRSRLAGPAITRFFFFSGKGEKRAPDTLVVFTLEPK